MRDTLFIFFSFCLLKFAFCLLPLPGAIIVPNKLCEQLRGEQGRIQVETQFEQVTDAAELDRLFARSHEHPVLLFKHSSTCPISAQAYRQMREVKGPISIVVVQKSRAVSREVEARTGVPHESPQALVLRGGQAVWSASHFDITADAVERALKNAEG